ncbi:putative NBD/HSP70 family sugar kinase [Streptomyces sp. SAI-135]|jgi:predicted NBD/HSP70 family sugar kinase|uniref:ROK family transcriptional regulator n=1 Tax=unclassified Streptomyces TaxID=2593676 RepID=UPI002474961E|nr:MULTISPECIES: ROK family transcriptional regulator [unclassified Streptomyces]MDH6514565.1 putative NBD/HSP70 family sugar kinase [Streptomyces sp. SAI-090]MDH6546745.1 putative NBD/HSP70 family sugar kinase [Streptomyces sp. SAI-041]MDH6565850.1 putative NBD/HSP70 family sugar kinase [Streptomyces sp. SAI-117]MDH6589233.1 putative NBD/HSP70 family sugar kinase [Streptomyces sp. SAI-133]MDH6621352.1 putative NBD/HSP70 family sugar kinase [Streptomyces sp. SAI-135]
MTAVAASWLPLSAGERSVAIEVLVHGPLSRTELARRLDLSAGSLTRLTKPLIESGLLIEVPEAGAPAEVRQGRPSQPLDVVVGSRSFVGFKITEDMVYGVVTTLRSEIVARHDRPLAGHDPAEVADLLAEMTSELARVHPRLAGIGIGVGGFVQERAVVGESPFLHWRDVPLGELVEERTGLPVVVENDVAALVEAETWFGAGRGLDRFVVLTIGAGIGYGLVLGGRRVPYAEEDRGFGRHWIIDPGGPLTPDGNRGSAVSLLTIPSIRYQVHAATGRDHTYEEILALAAAGDPMPARVIAEAGRALGVLIAQIANFAMPQKIMLAGEGVGLMDVAGKTVEEAIRSHRHPLATPVDLETRVSDFHDWARGAAVLAIQVLVLGVAEV